MGADRMGSCCGVDELYSITVLRTERDCFSYIQGYYSIGRPGAQAIFADVVRTPTGVKRTRKGGALLAKVIKKYSLGRLVTLKARQNVFHIAGNRGYNQTWLWSPPRTLTPQLKKVGVKCVIEADGSGEDNYWR